MTSHLEQIKQEIISKVEDQNNTFMQLAYNTLIQHHYSYDEVISIFTEIYERCHQDDALFHSHIQQLINTINESEVSDEEFTMITSIVHHFQNNTFDALSDDQIDYLIKQLNSSKNVPLIWNDVVEFEEEKQKVVNRGIDQNMVEELFRLYEECVLLSYTLSDMNMVQVKDDFMNHMYDVARLSDEQIQTFVHILGRINERNE